MFKKLNAIFNRDLFGRPYVTCRWCGYEKNQPDVLRVCSKCGRLLKSGRKWGWILISYALFSIFKDVEMTEDDLATSALWLSSLVLAPLFFYWIRDKAVFIRNTEVRNLVIGLCVVVLFVFLIQFLGDIGNRLI